MKRKRAGSLETTGVLAPWPQIDRYPIIIGSNISFASIASASRQALNGYRQRYVDVMSELLDCEPHGASVIGKRVLGVAGGRCEVTPADMPAGSSAAKKALEISDHCGRMIRRIPHRTGHFATLLWALYYGISGSEVLWNRTSDGWTPTGLQFVHSRRLSYPNYGAWDLHVWDMGAVVGWDNSPTNQDGFGLRVDDYPGKFIIHSPQLRADYPTREGLGRILTYYFAIKRLILRVSAQDFERFVRPWVIAYFATTDEKTGKPRVATTADRDSGDAAAKALGSGSLASATLPDSIKIELLNAASKMSQDSFLEYLDSAASKLAVGQTYTTQPGANGSRAASEVGKGDADELALYDATCFADTLTECLLRPFLRLNYPGCEDLVPTLKLHVEEQPDHLTVMSVAEKAVAMGMPVDADALGDRVGLPLVDPKDDKSRRLLPLKPVDPSVLDDRFEAPEVPEDRPPAKREIEEPDEGNDEDVLDEAAE